MKQRGRTLRVLIVGHGPPTTGGIPTFVARLVSDRWLQEQCERIDFLNTHPPGVKRPGSLSFSNVRLTFAHAVAIFRGARRADVVHLNLAAEPLLPLLRAFVLCLAAKLAGSAVVLHAHTGQIEHCLDDRRYRSLMLAVLRVVDALVVVSRGAQEAVRRLGSRKVHHVENGIDADQFSVGPKQHDPPLLTFVGTVCKRKGLIDLRDALASLSKDSRLPVEVCVVGDGEQEGPGAFEMIRNAYRYSGVDVDFRGAMPHDDVLDILARTSIFCLPSHTEGFPISILEAMASATAVVATRVGDVPAMLDEGKAGLLVDVGDVSGLRDAIRRLANDWDQRSELQSTARARAEQVYGYDKMVRSLFDVYLAVARTHASPTRTARHRAGAR